MKNVKHFLASQILNKSPQNKFYITNINFLANLQDYNQETRSLVAKLAPPHAQSAWGSRRERVRAARLAAC